MNVEGLNVILHTTGKEEFRTGRREIWGRRKHTANSQMNHMAAPKVQEERQDGPWPSGATWPGSTPNDFTVKEPYTLARCACRRSSPAHHPIPLASHMGEISATKSRSIRLWKQIKALATPRAWAVCSPACVSSLPSRWSRSPIANNALARWRASETHLAGRQPLSSLIPMQRSLVEQGVYCIIDGSVAPLPAASHVSLRVLICEHWSACSPCPNS